MSFWIQTVDYKSGDGNGTTYFSVSGVPGGYGSTRPFPVVECLNDGLVQRGGLITQELVDEVTRVYVNEEADDHTPEAWLHEAIASTIADVWMNETDEELQARLDAGGADYPIHPRTLEDFRPDKDLNYPGGFFLCRWLARSVGKVVSGAHEKPRYVSY
jgi:hypothetical protein